MIKKGEKKMIQMTKEEADALLRKLRILRRESGEMIAFLEHLMQTQVGRNALPERYDPDDYVDLWRRWTCGETD